jgi:hypothetical protein
MCYHYRERKLPSIKYVHIVLNDVSEKDPVILYGTTFLAYLTRVLGYISPSPQSIGMFHNGLS